jgi:hypothetical protein
MLTEIRVDHSIEKIIDDWDFFDETILKRFSTFRPVGQNIYGIRARAVGNADVVDPKKGVMEAIVMTPRGVVKVERAPLEMSITAGGVPHRVRHSFGYWHINDMDELAVAIPPLPGEELGRTLLLMQTPTENEGESFAWYCNDPNCNTLLHEYHYNTGHMGFEGFWKAETAAVERYNSDPRNRTCPECGNVNPLAYCWNVAKDKPAQTEARVLW